MGEADEYYITESKKNEDEFLEALKNGGNIEKVQKYYEKKAKKIRKKYEKRYAKELRKKKKETVKKKKKEKDKKFIVEHVQLQPTSYDEWKRKTSLNTYKTGREISRIFRYRIFDFFRYIRYRIKYAFRDIKVSITIRKEKIAKWTGKKKVLWKERFIKLKAILKKIKEKVKKKQKKIMTKIKSLFKKKKGKEEGDKDKKEESTEKKEEEKEEGEKEVKDDDGKQETK